MVSNKEIWKDIEGFPGYQVSNQGRVKNKKTGHVLKPQINNRSGYYQVSLSVGGKSHTVYIHHLVASGFLGKRPNGYDIDHNDTNKLNNKASNLEYCTRSENISRTYKTGSNPYTTQVEIIETGEVFSSISECAKAINGDPELIRQCLNPKYSRYRHNGYHFKVVNDVEKVRVSQSIKIVETGEKFNSLRECASAINGNHHNIAYALKTGKAYKDLHFEYIGSEEKKERTTSFLYDYQLDAVNRLHNGCILCGNVGSGKSRTGLFYYIKENGGWPDKDNYKPMKNNPQDLYIITTAKKRNDKEWEKELSVFLLSTNPKQNMRYGNKIVVDSWNNIGKYKDVTGAFFLLDEQRVVGNGSWVKTFLKIAKNNNWILLTGTPGDSYLDYVPVFLANGFFKNRTEFNREHVIYARFTKYPKVEGYQNTMRLDRLRNKVLVKMNYQHKINAHHEDVYCKYDIAKYKDVVRRRWDIFKDEPIQQASGLCYVLRRIVNTDESREIALLEILEKTPRAIIFYSFDYELDLLKHLFWCNDGNEENPLSGFEVAEYNGHCHQDVPKSKKWVYLVNYNAGAEGWENTSTDTIIFFSQNYSYKIMTQAAGRIDRLNTPFTDLYYYHLRSRSGIDLAISKALAQKKKFNERKFTKWDK